MEGSANGFAYLALFLFLPFGVGLFFVTRPPVAALLIFLIAFMFLPELVDLDLPGFPPFSKQELASLACFMGAGLKARKKLLVAKPLRGPDLIFLLLFIGDVGTALTNTDVIQHGPRILPALDLHEAFSVIIYDSFGFFLPFFLGRALFTTAKDLKFLLTAIAVAGAVYTPFEFIELMMSPQLNLWIYGFHQHSFLQTIRGGGYRPMVFMPHGLAVGLFMCWASLASVILARRRKKVVAAPAGLVAVYDFGFLVWCKSLGAAVYTLAMAPILYFLSAKSIVRIASVLAIIVFAYPILRAADLFPRQSFVNIAQSVAGGDRAQSLDFRFSMEEVLSAHARERPVFGWGRFMRANVFDDVTGESVSVSDGFWIVMLTIRGYWGFACAFLPVLIPIFRLRKKLTKIEGTDERFMLAGLAGILAIGSVDLLPNGLWNAILYVFAGALWGTTKALSSLPPSSSSLSSPDPVSYDDSNVHAHAPSPAPPG